MKIFIDSDILIWHLRGEHKAARLLRRLQKKPENDLWIGALQRAEIVFFMRPEEEDNTMLFLSQFKTAPVDESVINMAGIFYRTWSVTHGLDVNDAILAATALFTNGTIICLNTKHYPMPGLKVQRGWK